MANEHDSNLIMQILALPESMQVSVFIRNAHLITDDSNYWNLLGTAWKKGGLVMQQELWLPLFRSKRRNRHKIMKSRERKRWRRLPKMVTAYRAVNSDDEIDTAISWSLSKKIVEKVFTDNGRRKIVKRQFKKREIFALFDRRGEEEILVNI